MKLQTTSFVTLKIYGRDVESSGKNKHVVISSIITLFFYSLLISYTYVGMQRGPCWAIVGMQLLGTPRPIAYYLAWG